MERKDGQIKKLRGICVSKIVLWRIYLSLRMKMEWIYIFFYKNSLHITESCHNQCVYSGNGVDFRFK
ncbi:hypothetical protein CCP2SC5_170013 [Azospirillaceae bacterium]